VNEYELGKNAADWDRNLIEEQLAEYSRSQREPDPLGKRALFSVGARATGPLGTLTLECSSCRRESPVRLREIPSLAFPFWMTAPRKHPTYMRCPGCGRRTWLRPRWRL
jgi:hypothetical protein